MPCRCIVEKNRDDPHPDADIVTEVDGIKADVFPAVAERRWVLYCMSSFLRERVMLSIMYNT